MDRFVYTGLPARVIFGYGTIDVLAAEVNELGMTRPLVLTTPEQAATGERVMSILDGKTGGLFAGAVMHTPVQVTNAALDIFSQSDADSLIAIGGGSTIGLGKALALRTDCPQLVIPTTYAGSEMTPIIGQVDQGRKTTQSSLKVLPETVLYDVDLTLSLPLPLSLTSGMNAIAHAVEALYAVNANPVLSLMAEEGIRALAQALPAIANNAKDRRQARYDALYGAWLCGICLGSGGVALHHKLCHVLGGTFDLPHAQTHTAVLPHALAFNAPNIGSAMERLRHALATDDPAGCLYDIASTGGAQMALRDLGMPKAGIDQATELALQQPYANPRPLSRDGITALLSNAWSGARPGAA